MERALYETPLWVIAFSCPTWDMKTIVSLRQKSEHMVIWLSR